MAKAILVWMGVWGKPAKQADPPLVTQRKMIYGIGGPEGPRWHWAPERGDVANAIRIQGIRTLVPSGPRVLLKAHAYICAWAKCEAPKGPNYRTPARLAINRMGMRPWRACANSNERRSQDGHHISITQSKPIDSWATAQPDGLPAIKPGLRA